MVDAYIKSTPDLHKKPASAHNVTKTRKSSPKKSKPRTNKEPAYVTSSASVDAEMPPADADYMASFFGSQGSAQGGGIVGQTSSESGRASGSRWDKASAMEEQPVTPKKRKGWFGTDGRACVKGEKSPPKAKPWIESYLEEQMGQRRSR